VVRKGNGTLEAAKRLGWDTINCVVTDLKSSDAISYAIADNRTAELAEWDDEVLAAQLNGLLADDPELMEVAGFTEEELAALLADSEIEPEVIEDEVPEPPVDPITKPGDLWILGRHRVMCGDSTSAEDVGDLMRGKACLLHADPPYGMGKEKDGVKNDNLYNEKLDTFQMEWWNTFRPYLDDNASAYIWGNTSDLWRLWYIGGLLNSERLTFRNEIAWDKGGGGFGVGTASQRCYFPEERCLFFMLGEQGFNNNSDNYWQGWEPIRSYLATEMEKCGGRERWREALGNQMGSHYFTTSQWCLPTQEAYAKLQAFAKGTAFKREYDELKREYDELKREFYSTRAYFDNTHDNMTDVWKFSRVTGEERHGHATPKPVAMIGRAVKSSSAEGSTIAEPFLGSGTTLIACEQLGRKCYGMEISSQYVDVICNRWAKLTNESPVLEETGETFDQVAKRRRGNE
jgi:DNA modification methylase